LERWALWQALHLRRTNDVIRGIAKTLNLDLTKMK